MPMADDWLVTEESPLSAGVVAEIERETPAMLDNVTRGAGDVPRLAVLLRNVICHDVLKLFGGAEVRLDALVVHGRGTGDDPSSFYMPGTFRFSDIRDHQSLPIDPDHGLLIFNGQPMHFLDVFVIASRDRKETDDLSSLLREKLTDDATKTATSALLGLAVAVPTAAVVTGAIAAAATLGDLAYQVVKGVSDKTIGMYRGSFLQFRDGFGVGRHPAGTTTFQENSLEFWYETVLDEVPAEP
jgi:hypothetical protein